MTDNDKRFEVTEDGKLVRRDKETGEFAELNFDE